MSTDQRALRELFAFWALLLLLGLAATGSVGAAAAGPTEPLVVVNLDGVLLGRAGDEAITASLGPGARFVGWRERRGVEPGENGAAVIVPVPDRCWRPAGTLAFWFRLSRTIRFASDRGKRPQPLVLAECPLFRVELSEEPSNTMLRVVLSTAGAPAARPRHRSLMWSRVEGERWYHLAVAWDAPRGQMEAYLNGALQEALNVSGPEGGWSIPSSPAGPLRLGGSTGEGKGRFQASVGSAALYGGFMDHHAVSTIATGGTAPALQGEGRTEYAGELDLTPYKLQLLHEADFSKPLDVVSEEELFDGDRRVRLPAGKQWVLEGPGRAWTADGRLWLESRKPDEGGHVVLWNTRVFPQNFLLEFGVSPQDSKTGLNIVFFCAAPRQGGGIFDLELPRRNGVFANYHSGALHCYHVSYWAAGRRTANVRKNYGFFLVNCGCDRMDGQGAGPHRVRVLKVGGKVLLETRGQLAAAFTDDGTTYGPILGSGAIGLRQMAHTARASYSHFKVWRVEPRETGR